jgi:aminoglycoside phosphotransferase (APT) family kinase protein
MDALNVIDTVRQVLGCGSRVLRWYVQRPDYGVAVVDAEGQHLVVKLASGNSDRPWRDFEVMSTLTRLAAPHVPVPEVIAASPTYLISRHVQGLTWDELFPRLDARQKAVGQWQLGEVAAQLTAVPFPTFGQIDKSGNVIDGEATVPALVKRLERRVKSLRSREFFLNVLFSHATSFRNITPTLTHEDLNPYNVVFEMREELPVLTGVLDFEAAWAGVGESDLARLELWRLTGGRAVRAGYESIKSPDEGYGARRPVLQLLWCLEYADQFPTSDHQAVTDQVCHELGIEPLEFEDR